MAYIRCASCNRTLSSKSTKCPYCGASPLKTDNKSPVGTPVTERPTELTPPPVRKKKKTSASPSKKKPELPDMTAKNTVTRFIWHTVVSVIGYGIAFLLAGLLIDLLEDLFAPALVLSTLKHTRAFMSGSAIIFGFAVGGLGPIGKGSYIEKIDAPKIIRARALPLQWLSLSYLLLCAGAVVFYIISRAQLPHVVESNFGTDKEILTLAISFSVAVYYAFYTLGTFIKVIASRCPRCHHIDCKVKYGESAHTTRSETEQRERTVAGASYDVYTTSGVHVGTVQGSDSTVTETRTVTTEEWQVSWRCAHCGYCGESHEGKVAKTKWN